MNNDRRIILDTIRRLGDDYNQVNREYNSNMTEYNRNFNQLLNLVSNQSFINRVDSRRNTRNREQLETEILGAYLAQLNQQIIRERREMSGLNEEQINSTTEIVEYDGSMNEIFCPITHEEFEVGEEVCRITHCGHYFKTSSIRRWLRRNTICPVCRHNLIQAPVNNNTNTQFISNILSNVFPMDNSLNTVTYTFDIPFNPQM